MSRSMTKPIKWHVPPVTTQISLSIRPMWSESAPSAWIYLGPLAIHRAHSEDSDQTGHWADPPTLIGDFAGCLDHFCFVLSCCGIYISRSLSLRRTHGLGRLGLMMMLSHCRLQVASNFDYRIAQSVLRSRDDLNFVGLIPRLSFPFRFSFFLFPETLDINGIHYTQIAFGRDCLTESLNKPLYSWTLTEVYIRNIAKRLSKFKITSVDK